MGTALTIVTWVGGIVGAIAVGFLKDEAASWLPRLNKVVLAAAVKHLPPDQRERSQEEWSAHVEEYPGKLSQLVQCLRFLKAADQLRTIDKSEVDRNLRFTGYAMILLNVVQYVGDKMHGYGFWTDHVLGYIEFLVTVRVCFALWWLVRYKPQVLQRIGRPSGGP